jgi:hypothetical protein
MNPFDKYNNQEDVVDIDKFLAQQQAANKKQTKTVAPKKKSGNFFTHLLPTIGGTGGGVAGGAAGGALAGSAILPGIGTAVGGLAGALIGGFGGGAAGKAVENKVEGQKITNGVLGQGIEQGVLSAGPLKLLKGATIGTKAAVGAARDGEGLAGAINAAGEKAVTPLIRTQAAKTGAALRGEARGIKPGVTQAGTSQRLTPAQSDQVNEYLNSLGTKNSAHSQVRAVADDLKTSGKQIGDLVAQHDRSLSTPEVASIRDAATSVANKSLGFNAKDPLITDTEKRIGQIEKSGSLSDAKELRDTLDDQLKSFYSKGERNTTTTTAVENVLKGYRDGINKVLQKSVPGFKEANSRYATGLKAQQLLLKSANPNGFRILGVQTGVGGEGLQASKDLTGRALSKVGTKSDGGASPFGLGAVSSRTLPVGLTQASAASIPQVQPTDQSGQGNDLTSALMSAQGGSSSGEFSDPSSATSQASSSPYSQENLISDIQRDPKNADKYISTYKSLADIFAASQPAKLNSTQQQQAFNAQSGLESLQKIADTLQTNPNAAKLSSLPGGSITANLTGTGEYKAAVNNAVDVIGRLRSGGAIGQEEEKNFLALLPQTGDNSDTINYKLQQLASVFQNFANPVAASTANSSDLTSALLAAQGGQ